MGAFGEGLNMSGVLFVHTCIGTYLEAMVGQIEKPCQENGLSQLGQRLRLGLGILQTAEVDDGNGGKSVGHDGTVVMGMGCGVCWIWFGG